MRKSNLTYEQLIKLAPKNKPFQIEVEDEWGIKGKLWVHIIGSRLACFFMEKVDWKKKYNKFTLIDEYRNMYSKPDLLEVGTEVEILESARDCGEYDEWSESHKEMIGEVFRIDFVQDDSNNIYYEFYTDIPYKGASHCFPHYCVRPVEKVEEEDESIVPDFDNIIEKLNDLCDKAQDIINKYKK